jgi:hypothetical protein
MLGSNFTGVRLSKDETTLEVSGTSDAAATVKAIHVAAAEPKPADPANPGLDLAPKVEDQSRGTLGTVAPAGWTVDVPITAGSYEVGDLVVLAGTAVHSSADPVELETWIGIRILLAHGEDKPDPLAHGAIAIN